MRKWILMLALAVMAFSSALAQASLKEIRDRGFIRIAIANEIPYAYVDASGEAKGPGPEVAKAVLARLGITDIQWVVVPFGSLIPGLLANRFDMVAAEMAILPQRCQQVIYSEPNTTYGEGLLVRVGNPKKIYSYEDFAKRLDLRVVIMAGADQLDMLHALGVPDERIVTIQNNADAISTLVTGRADAYAATSLTVSELAAKDRRVEVASPFTDPVIKGKAVRSWGGFTFNKGSSELRDAFNRELVAFKKTPQWAEILKKHGFTQADIDASFKRTTAELCRAQ
jgi:polar amino acid transport system substrate-binding protein